MTKRIIVAILLAGTLAACGKKGHLETPPGSTYPAFYPPGSLDRTVNRDVLGAPVAPSPFFPNSTSEPLP